MSPADLELLNAINQHPKRVSRGPSPVPRALATMLAIVALWIVTIVALREGVRLAKSLGWLS